MKQPTEDTPIEVKDERLSDFLWIDREIRRESPNGETWQALLQPLCVSIYVCLCGHASGEKGKPNKPRESFPSYATIARECGISRRAAIEGISTLISFGFLRKGESTKYRTNIFFIQSREKWFVAAEKGRKTRTDKGTSRKIVNDIHHVKNDAIVKDIHSDSESYSPSIVNIIHPDSESYSPEVKSLKKSHLKESQRGRETQTSKAEETSTASHALSSSPSGMVFLSFFKGECEHLSDAQIKMICAIPDSELFKSAIEYLQGNGVQKLWNKVSLIKTKMQELAAVSGSVASAGGAASPARSDVLPAVRLTPKAANRQRNLDYLQSRKMAVAETILDASPRVAIMGE